MPFIAIDNLGYSKTVDGSKAGSRYTVTWGASQFESDAGKPVKDWSCTCPDWIYRKKSTGGYCKHIEAVINTPTDDGGPCFWAGKSLMDVLMIPSLEAFLRLYLSSNMKRFTDATVTHCWDGFVASFLPYAPYTDEYGDFIPAVFVPTLSSNHVYCRGDRSLEVYMVVLGSDNVEEPEILVDPEREPSATIESVKDKLGNGSSPRRMGIPLPK
jgi:hypothetical protein